MNKVAYALEGHLMLLELAQGCLMDIVESLTANRDLQ